MYLLIEIKYYTYSLKILTPFSMGLILDTSNKHIFSQQGIWMSYGHRNPQKSPFRTPPKISKNVSFKHIIEYFYLNIIPMALYLYMGIILYFVK